MENKLKETRSNYEVEKEELMVEVEEMKHHYMENKYQTEIKMKINSELKDALDGLPEPDSEDIKLSFYEKSETKLPLLFDIYIQIYKYAEPEVCLTNLIEEMPIHSEENKTLTEWSLL